MKSVRQPWHIVDAFGSPICKLSGEDKSEINFQFCEAHDWKSAEKERIRLQGNGAQMFRIKRGICPETTSFSRAVFGVNNG